jgi:hypothetical protein
MDSAVGFDYCLRARRGRAHAFAQRIWLPHEEFPHGYYVGESGWLTYHLTTVWRYLDRNTISIQLSILRYALGHREPIILHNPPRVAHLSEPTTFPVSPSFSLQIQLFNTT